MNEGEHAIVEAVGSGMQKGIQKHYRLHEVKILAEQFVVKGVAQANGIIELIKITAVVPTGNYKQAEHQACAGYRHPKTSIITYRRGHGCNGTTYSIQKYRAYYY